MVCLVFQPTQIRVLQPIPNPSLMVNCKNEVRKRKGLVRKMQTRHVKFFPWYQWLKPPLVDIGAPPRYTSGHQVSSGQELGLATKAYTS
jgi:hypothetical protein